MVNSVMRPRLYQYEHTFARVVRNGRAASGAYLPFSRSPYVSRYTRRASRTFFT